MRKGGKHVTIPIAPRTGQALDLYKTDSDGADDRCLSEWCGDVEIADTHHLDQEQVAGHQAHA